MLLAVAIFFLKAAHGVTRIQSSRCRVVSLCEKSSFQILSAVLDKTVMRSVLIKVVSVRLFLPVNDAPALQPDEALIASSSFRKAS